MSNEIIDVEYRVATERTLDVIASEIKLIEQNMVNAVMGGSVNIGKRLKEAKEKVEHGNWESWCNENLNYSSSWAAKLMKIAEEYGDENSPYYAAISNLHTSADLSVSKALRLLQVPENEVESFVKTQPIDNMTVAELEGKIKELKEEKASSEKVISDLEKKQEKKNKEIEELKNKNKALMHSISEEKRNAEDAAKDAIEKAVEEAKSEAIKEVNAAVRESLDASEKHIKEQDMKILNLEKQLKQSSNEALAVHKVKMEHIKNTASDIVNNLNSLSDDAERNRLKDGFKRFLTMIAESI